MKKVILILAVIATVLACGEKKPSTTIDGKKIYKQNCVLCHGADGSLGANGSKDLSQSTMSLDERKAIIKNGKGKMIGLGSLLSTDEIDAVAAFTFKLKK